MVKLTAEMILKKTKLQRLEDVRNLNLFAYDITDAAVLSGLPNVEVLSLSMNRITHLEDFTKCLRLRELYLRRNQVTSLEQVNHLVHLKELKVLWLSDNPCAALPGYEEYVRKALPQLQMLDNMCTQADDKTQGIVTHARRCGANSVAVHQLDVLGSVHAIPTACGQQTDSQTLVTSDITPIAMGVTNPRHGTHVRRADSMLSGCHESIPKAHATDKSTFPNVMDRRGQIRSAHSIPVSLASSIPPAPGSRLNVFKAVTHLLEELEAQQDWNALMAIHQDIQCRLDRSGKHEIQEQ